MSVQKLPDGKNTKNWKQLRTKKAQQALKILTDIQPQSRSG
jgi:hypothetical protein